MSRSRFSLLRNLAKDTIKYGMDRILDKNSNFIGNFILDATDWAKKMGFNSDIVEKAVDKGLNRLSDIKTYRPGEFFNNRVLPVGEVFLTDIIHNLNNNGGNAAYPQESYGDKFFFEDILTPNDYFRNMREENRSYKDRLRNETERIKELEKEGKPLLSEETRKKLIDYKVKKSGVKLIGGGGKKDMLLAVETGEKKGAKQMKAKGGAGTPKKQMPPVRESKENVAKEMTSKQSKGGHRKRKPEVEKALRDLQKTKKERKKNYQYKVEL